MQEVLDEAEEIEGGCKVTHVDWRVAPLGSPTTRQRGRTLTSPNGSPARDRTGARPAVKAAIAAANSIATTPYVWGGGHGSFYSSGYDCSGAVSFALYGGGLLDTPLTSRRAGELRRTRPRQWITIYANADPRLRGDRRAALGHGRRRPRHRPALVTEPPYPADALARSGIAI